MKRLALFAWILMLQASGVSAEGPLRGNARIQGIVLASGTNAPLAGARVTLFQKTTEVNITTHSGGPEPAEAGSLAISDGSGRFEFGGLDAGSYSLSIVRKGYGDKRTDNMPVLADETVSDVVIRLTPLGSVTGVVSGRIYNSSGRPMGGLPVELLRRKYNSSGKVTFDSAAQTETNDLGEYRFYWVEPGRYYLVASGDSSGRRGDNWVRASYPASYYPGVQTVDEASIIDVGPGTETSGINFGFVRRPSFSIRGRVIDLKTGRPPQRTYVSATHRNLKGSIAEIGSRVRSDPSDGTFELTDVPPGAYLVQARQSNGSDPAFTASMTVDIGSSDVEGLLLPIAAPLVVTGQVKVEGHLPTGLDQFHIDLVPDGPFAWPTETGTFASGRPHRRVSREQHVAARACYVKEAHNEGADVLHNVKPFAPGTLEVVINCNAGRLEGVVRNADLQRKPGALTLLVPDEGRNRTELFKEVIADKDGHYTITGIPPGEYKLFAWENLEPHSYFDPEVLKRFEAKGSPVRISESARETVDVTIIPGGATP